MTLDRQTQLPRSIRISIGHRADSAWDRAGFGCSAFRRVECVVGRRAYPLEKGERGVTPSDADSRSERQ